MGLLMLLSDSDSATQHAVAILAQKHQMFNTQHTIQHEALLKRPYMFRFSALFKEIHPCISWSVSLTESHIAN